MAEQMTIPLPEDWEELVGHSRAVRENAYAPYSNFAVGACVRTHSHHLFTGCNVENSSFGLTICAERVAATSAVAKGHHDFQVVCISLAGPPVPCGACRQFLYEFNPELILILDDVERSPKLLPDCISLSELLPRGFRLTE